MKHGSKLVPPQFYFEIAQLGNAKKWRKIQNIVVEKRVLPYRKLQLPRSLNTR